MNPRLLVLLGILTIIVGCAHPAYKENLGKRLPPSLAMIEDCTETSPCDFRQGDYAIRYSATKLNDTAYQIEGTIERQRNDASKGLQGEVVVYAVRDGVINEFDTFWVTSTEDGRFDERVEFEQAPEQLYPMLGVHYIGEY